MEYRQIQRRTAKKLFLQGKTIYLLPCKLNIEKNNTIPVSTIKESDNNDNLWDIMIKFYITQYCNCELGRYPHFYIKLD